MPASTRPRSIHHTGRSALYFYGRLSELTDSQIAARERDVFDMVDLTGREHEPVRRYSKGMRQRLGLAQALLHDPELLIMDEPTKGVDVGAKAAMYEIMGDLAQKGLAIIMISSEMPEILGMCDRIVVLHEGKKMGELLRKEATQEKIMALCG